MARWLMGLSSSTSVFSLLTCVVFLFVADAEDGLHAPVGFPHSVTAAHMPVVKTEHCMRVRANVYSTLGLQIIIINKKNTVKFISSKSGVHISEWWQQHKTVSRIVKDK